MEHTPAALDATQRSPPCRTAQGRESGGRCRRDPPRAGSEISCFASRLLLHWEDEAECAPLALTRTVIVSVSAAAVVALGVPAQAPASARATHRAALAK